jgi:ketosteroid isomerase-like protein
MSLGSVEILREVYEASDAEGFEPLLRASAEDLVWISDPRMPGGGTHTGKDAVRSYLDQLAVFEGGRVEIHEIRDLGDRVLGITTYRAKPPEGPPVEWVWCHLVSFREGEISEVRSFIDRESALEAAGLSE